MQLLFLFFIFLIWLGGALFFGIVFGIISLIIGLIGFIIKLFLKKYNAKIAIECAQQYKRKLVPTRLEALKIAENVLIHFHKIRQESLVVLFLDDSNYCVEVKISFGDECSVEFSPEEILKIANSMNVSKLVVMHNHPDEKPIPSDQDVLYIANLQNILGDRIKIVDALVWCRGGIKSILNTHRFKEMVENY
ncbi:MAG: hypothetical protein JRI96_17850 [Deltaproteobacteria bacterium]|nr:hypothetical protein [Deltaproteobacteria bacterium]